MTFSCKNFDHDSGTCRKLGGECIPGRPGCVLDGQVTLSDELKKRLEEFDGRGNKRND
ncbi:hypothetical protein EDC39_11557 [Geothermobacter ehrlichii]|uniref:Uncharacterized protein n=1 Tax=Geothermobacter ehrlichii TaxID=213224 RepID=A0A5D3WGQ9_9BACT|nr:hypothetical protein [Geothermobacter ehrlichii]TYO96111.1 hypothetical protein EDC39_11557 [Geothermobacter ehrlichii]